MTPSTKVTVATGGSAVAVILVWLGEMYWVSDIPGPVELAVAVLVTAGVTLLAGWLPKERNPSPSTVEAVNNQ